MGRGFRGAVVCVCIDDGLDDDVVLNELLVTKAVWCFFNVVGSVGFDVWYGTVVPDIWDSTDAVQLLLGNESTKRASFNQHICSSTRRRSTYALRSSSSSSRRQTLLRARVRHQHLSKRHERQEDSRGSFSSTDADFHNPFAIPGIPHKTSGVYLFL